MTQDTEQYRKGINGPRPTGTEKGEEEEEYTKFLERCREDKIIWTK